VWRAITECDEVAGWFSQRAAMPSSPGEEGWLEWDGSSRFIVRLEAIEPIRHLAWRWASVDDPDFDAAANLVEWTLEPTERGGTRLHLRETGFAGPQSRRDNVEGWLSELGELVGHLAAQPWEQGIRRTWSLRSPLERVWRAFSDPAEFAAWWGSTELVEPREGFAGWFAWPREGRYAVRIDRVEPPTYLAWRWTTRPDVAFEEADEILRTEWALASRPDGGTDIHLLETGFRGPDAHRQNGAGWDDDVAPVLRRHLGEDAGA
jgi:uncharacterized protein YndB with AHSA1/START domain